MAETEEVEERNEQGGKYLASESSRARCTRSSTNLEYRPSPSDRGDCSPGIRTTWLLTDYEPDSHARDRVDRAHGEGSTTYLEEPVLGAAHNLP